MADSIPFYFGLAIGPAFVGARTQRLADLLSEQGTEFFNAVGIVAPARTVSTILYLRHNGPASLVQIAKALDEPHQVTAKRTSRLEALTLLSCRPDPDDGRRRVFKLTRKGSREARLIEERCKEAIQVFEDLNQELEFRLGEALDAAYDALTRKSIFARSTATPIAGRKTRAS